MVSAGALLALLTLCAGADAGDSLERVVVLYRHGDRTPINPYPTDPYGDASNWPVGFGQLTPRGKQMQYELGQYLGKRYGSLVGKAYNETSIYVRSTDVDRTLMSALSNLAGLFPPSGGQVWNQQLLWQPVPVHTVPLQEDKLLSSHAKCPKFERLLQQLMESDEMSAIDKENADLYAYLTEHSGRNITNVIDVDYIYDTLFIETVYNKTLPEWTKKVYPQKMKKARDQSFLLTTWNPELARLRAGPLVDHLLSVAKGEAGSPGMKMLMLSAHDTTLASLMNALGMYDPPVAPPYASLVVMEVHKGSGDDAFVRFLYRNSSDQTEPRHLVLPGCKFDCPVGDFARLTADLRPGDAWERECGLAPAADTTARIVTGVSMAVCGLLLLLLVSAVVVNCVRSKERERSHNYQSLSQDLA